MANLKKTAASVATAVSLLGLGAAGQRLAAPPLPISASFDQLEVLHDEDPITHAPKYRYAIKVKTRAGANPGGRQVVCENDGSAPKLNGILTTEPGLVAACKAAPTCYQAIQGGIVDATDTLNRL